MCTTDDRPRSQHDKRSGTKSVLLQELAQIRERVATAGYFEARHFIAVAEAALEEASDPGTPSLPKED